MKELRENALKFKQEKEQKRCKQLAEESDKQKKFAVREQMRVRKLDCIELLYIVQMDGIVLCNFYYCETQVGVFTGLYFNEIEQSFMTNSDHQIEQSTCCLLLFVRS